MTSPQISRPVIILVLALAFAAQVYGQALSNQSASPALPLQAGVHEWIDGLGVPSARNLPFSAKVEIEAKQVLSDGTTLSHKSINLVARDDSGRTRTEGRELIKSTETRVPKISFISIYDPGTRSKAVLYPDQHLARVADVRPSPPSQPSTTPSQGSERPTSRKDDLGDQTIEGFDAHGTRITTTFPTGMVGNDRPFDVVNESWFSKDLQMTLLIVRNDPRYGTQTLRVTDINRSPAPALFEVPADYKIVNESKP